jgi:hypothetical protein
MDRSLILDKYQGSLQSARDFSSWGIIFQQKIWWTGSMARGTGGQGGA